MQDSCRLFGNMVKMENPVGYKITDAGWIYFLLLLLLSLASLLLSPSLILFLLVFPLPFFPFPLTISSPLFPPVKLSAVEIKINFGTKTEWAKDQNDKQNCRCSEHICLHEEPEAIGTASWWGQATKWWTFAAPRVRNEILQKARTLRGPPTGRGVVAEKKLPPC